MQLVVLSNDAQWNELAVETAGVEWKRAAVPFSFADHPAADAFFILNMADGMDLSAGTRPVFINSVTATLKQLKAPAGTIRINGWNSFLKRPLWEVAGNTSEAAAAVLKKINKNFTAVNDVPGLIAAPVVAMIINEAYFALGEEVSDKTAIDTAMKLGTNYPYGPFEWAELIGLKNIYGLLQTLSETGSRYAPAPALIKETLLNN